MQRGRECEVIDDDCLEAMGRNPFPKANLFCADQPFWMAKDWEGAAGYFSDKFGGLENQLEWMKPRLEAMQDLLTGSGSIHLHVDPSISRYLKVMKGIFGQKSFRMK